MGFYREEGEDPGTVLHSERILHSERTVNKAWGGPEPICSTKGLGITGGREARGTGDKTDTEVKGR